MRRITHKVKTLLYALALAAFAVCAPAAASAQSAQATMMVEPDATAQPAKTVSPTDTTAVTSVGLNAGVTSLASDSNGNVYATLQYSNKVVKLNGGGTVIGTFAVGRNP